ncbi:MAG: VOC family protein [Actinobacteria bacterium]|nr:VOC family protein [Actinomycetota bacterium]
MQKIVTNLWFDTESEEAAGFYISIFPNSKIVNITHYLEAGPREAGMVLTVDFELDGQRFTALNGGPDFKFNEAISLLVPCETQAEIDEYWKRLSDGGEEGPCGWLKDRYGVSWQITPVALEDMISDPDTAKANRAMAAMLKMGKLDLAALQKAYDGS